MTNTFNSSVFKHIESYLIKFCKKQDISLPNPYYLELISQSGVEYFQVVISKGYKKIINLRFDINNGEANSIVQYDHSQVNETGKAKIVNISTTL